MDSPEDPTHSSGGAMRAVKDYLSGWVGGISRVLAGQPFDTIKVRLQTQPDMYRGTVDAVRKTVQNDGFAGFYKGTTTPLVGVGIYVSVQFTVMEQMKRTFARINGTPAGQPAQLTPLQLYAAGATAGAATSVISGPVEHIRVRLQVQTAGMAAKYRGPGDCIAQIYRGHGIAGIYRGQAATMLRELSGYGMYFMAYEALIQHTMRATGRPRAEIPSSQVFIYGGAAGLAMWLTNYPFDFIKSKMQTDGFGPARVFRGTLDVARQTFQREGVRGFYRGITPCLLRAVPANAATFIGFEMALRALG
ncbi:Mitochondrial carrier protein ymc2 [Coemansia nantahalensis]|uniref:Mitochondrial carrier protein ymc2 n=1 Tax=Coemansia nantahalensis TaxID=2789366 RepID=A0ACC1K3D8_9FUNG|nr:Mitochondrial carrier protein ymc2 [Coemansia nantahalensis]KAJ2772686.1 Mitochondrial carrier protein ymc2 [Coemansia nantahalensis]